MLLENRIRGLKIYEKWFVFSEEEFVTSDILKFLVYRDARINIDNYFYKKEIKYTLITDLTEKEDSIFSKFTSNFRNEIRKVGKIDNCTIKNNVVGFSEFLEFYNQFAKQKELNLLTEQRLAKYGDNLFYISAYLDGELTNVQVYLHEKSKNISRLLYSVSTIHGLEDKIKRKNIGFINKALHGEAIKYFKNNGYKILDWGGYSNDKYNKALVGIDKFKKSFGGEIIEVYDYMTYLFYFFNILKSKIEGIRYVRHIRNK